VIGHRRSPLGEILALAVLAAGVAACTPLLVDGRDVDNTTWRAVSVAGRVPPAGAEPTLRFDFATVEGNAGCNGYVGQRQATITDGRLDLGEILATAGGCVDAAGKATPGAELEPVFLGALGAADRIELRGEQLVLSGPRASSSSSGSGDRGAARGRPVESSGQRGGRMAARRAGQPDRREESPSSPAQGSG
jgi:heat shock protein HslJ